MKNAKKTAGGGSGVKKKIIASLFSGSLIISMLSRVADFIYDKIENSLTGYLLSGHTGGEIRSKNSLVYTLSSRMSGKIKSAKFFIIRQFENSVILTAVNNRIKSLLYYPLKNHGVFGLAFGVLTIAVYLYSVYITGNRRPDVLILYCGVAIAVVALPAFTVKKRLIDCLLESKIMCFILCSVIGVREAKLATDEAPKGKAYAAFAFGVLFGLATYFVSPVSVIAVGVSLIIAYLFIAIPEFGVVVIFAALPFLPTMALAGMTLYLAFCYILKLIRGKRTIKFELVDASIALFMLLLLLGGVFSVAPSASLKPALVYVCFMMGYFLVVNLIRTSEWVGRCVFAIIFSSFIVSLYGIYEYFFGSAKKIWQDEEMFESIKGRVVSTFENPNVLAEYIIMTVPFIITLIIISKKPISKGVLLAVGGAAGACLVFTWSRGAWLGIMAGLLIYMFVYSRKTLVALFFGIGVLPFLPFVLPSGIVSRFTSIGNLHDTSTNYRVNIWKAVIGMVKDFFGGGIGVGSGAFTMIYPEYSLAGIESAPHSHNLYLQIIVEIGIIGLFVFLAIIFFFMRSNFSFYKSSQPSDKKYTLISNAGMCAVIAMLVQGMTDYVWYNYRVFFMFWLVMGLTLAVRRSVPSTVTRYAGTEGDMSVDIIYG